MEGCRRGLTLVAVEVTAVGCLKAVEREESRLVMEAGKKQSLQEVKLGEQNSQREEVGV